MADMSFAQLEDAAGSSNEVTRVTYICQGHEQKSDWGGVKSRIEKKYLSYRICTLSIINFDRLFKYRGVIRTS